MKKTLLNLFVLFRNKFRVHSLVGLFAITLPSISYSQCPGGYTSATVNWDYLDYLHSYGVYGLNNISTGQPNVSAAMRQTQKFAIGTNQLTLSTTINVANNGSLSGDVTTHTGETGAYGTGADIAYVKSGTGVSTITLTFLTEVWNLQFSVFDIDQEITFAPTATNAASVAQSITLTKPAGAASAIPLNGVAAATTITGTAPLANWATGGGSGTNYANTSNLGTINVDIAGPVKTVVLTFSNDGNANDFFLSDITACVADPGFPVNYYAPYTEPFTGQPSYFLANPQNLHVYMVNASTGLAEYIFSDPGATGTKMNGLAYDPVNKWLYYVMDNYPGASGGPDFNKALKKYDFNTETISTVLADITTLNIPTFEQGVEFAGAAFYNGSLYLGLEGTDGTTFTTNVESFVWKIDFDGAGVPTSATQVFALPGDDGAGSPTHDWGDFAIKDGIMITHATGLTSGNNRYVHFNMQTGASTTFVGTAESAGQIGQTWNGNVYRVKNHVAIYNNDGTIGTQTLISTTSCSPAWNPNAGDASDPFKPKCDFGDAPASYDPVALSPAVHQKHCNNDILRLGSAWDREWSKNTSADASGDATDEDGIGTVTILNSNGITYNHVQQITVTNNTGADATLGAWLDYNVNGIFEPGEGRIVTVPSTVSGTQNVTVTWSSLNIPTGTANTFLRVRLVSGSTALTTSNATGWYDDGEVEDYPVVSNNLPLTINLIDFTANANTDKTVAVNWTANSDEEADGFEIQRSTDQNKWVTLGWKNADTYNSLVNYEFTDLIPNTGTNYYRLKLVDKSGLSRFSNTKQVYIDLLKNSITVLPNPLNNSGTLVMNGVNNTSATLRIRNLSGQNIVNRNVIINKGENRIPLDVSMLQPGIYIVELSTNERVHTNKISVIR
jgi:GEVED domain/Secretion system C-terminal sorting domain